MAGRYAPSPTGELHIGNLRTALVAWLLAKSTGRECRLRFEDLDRERVDAAGNLAASQAQDLASLGLIFDGPALYQHTRLAAYEQAARKLEGRLYECFCTRKEIAEAASAPHGSYRPYPGTCRNLTEEQKREKRKTRPAAWRARAEGVSFTVHDRWAGDFTGQVDDFVVRRGDGTWAYNFASVVDDMYQGVDQVCRGEDLLDSAPRQAWLTELLGGKTPEYAHVPLVTNCAGERLSKRDGAVSMGDLRALGMSDHDVLNLLAESLGLPQNEGVEALIERFDPLKKPSGYMYQRMSTM
ncbi:MAG: tRNA glutamyl-Q(34) synthetase GluQRS [Propionibacteriaceae bacterium]|nr:tRNA glutamyl-Q(34) synthetase GluQRS [Propionibacteriaceae bacterium]